MTSRFRLFVAAFALLLGGCHTLEGDFPRSTALVPDGAIRLFPAYKIAYADALQIAGLAALVYTVVDPLAPNWDITETRVADGRVLFNLRMKDFSFGGRGEARQVLARRAEALSREQGQAGYQIQRYEESIDSRIIFPHRTAYAEVLLLAATTK